MSENDIFDLTKTEDLPEDLKKIAKRKNKIFGEATTIESMIINLLFIKEPLFKNEIVVGLFRKFKYKPPRMHTLDASICRMKKHGLILRSKSGAYTLTSAGKNYFGNILSNYARVESLLV